MKIYLKEYNRENPDFIEAFKPAKDGEVTIDTLKKVWRLESTDQIKKAVSNHPDFYVVPPTSANGDTNTKKDS